MIPDFTVVPAGDRLRIARATVATALVAAEGLAADADGLAVVDIDIVGGRIAAIAPAGASPANGAASLDVDDGMVLPCFVDMHTHLDKGHIWPRRPNPDGTFLAALEATRADREARWTAEDVRRRMEFSLKSAFAHGTRLIRTHLDSIAPQHRVSWPVFAELRAQWAGRVEMQAVALVPLDARLGDADLAELADVVAAHGGLLGGVTMPGPDCAAHVRRLLVAAAERGLDVDLHVDETLDPAINTLAVAAAEATAVGFPGRIVCGHCCSLSAMADPRPTLDAVAAAGIAIVSLPMCNLYLQDRGEGTTPRRRGVTVLHEIAARGIPVAVASDNTRDPFYAYGDLDMLEVFREATRIGHLDHPVGAWPRLIAAAPADILGRPDCGRLAVGAAADLVIARARTWTELHARPQADRIILRDGRAIDRRLPDYRDLDDLMEG